MSLFLANANCFLNILKYNFIGNIKKIYSKNARTQHAHNTHTTRTQHAHNTHTHKTNYLIKLNNENGIQLAIMDFGAIFLSTRLSLFVFFFNFKLRKKVL